MLPLLPSSLQFIALLVMAKPGMGFSYASRVHAARTHQLWGRARTHQSLPTLVSEGGDTARAAPCRAPMMIGDPGAQRRRTVAAITTGIVTLSFAAQVQSASQVCGMILVVISLACLAHS